MKIETSASTFRGRGVPEILLKCGRMWMGEGGGSNFRGFYVDIINVCSLTAPIDCNSSLTGC